MLTIEVEPWKAGLKFGGGMEFYNHDFWLLATCTPVTAITVGST